LERHAQDSHDCNRCGENSGYKITATTELTFPQEQKYLVLGLQIGNADHRWESRKISGFMHDRVQISGTLFRTVAAILHHGSVAGGHYQCVRKAETQNGWILLDDAKDPSARCQLARELASVSLLILEKK